jgi:hypothetical protein
MAGTYRVIIAFSNPKLLCQNTKLGEIFYVGVAGKCGEFPLLQVYIL